MSGKEQTHTERVYAEQIAVSWVMGNRSWAARKIDECGGYTAAVLAVDVYRILVQEGSETAEQFLEYLRARI